jgi:hypothetical protein
MQITQFEEIHKEKVESRIHQRYQREINQLQGLGFEELHYTRELVFPFSALFLCFIYVPLKWDGEIFNIEKPLRYVVLNPLLLNHHYDTYVHVFTMGVKFVTRFRDGTLLASCNYDTRKYIKPEKGIYRYSMPNHTDIGDCFAKHIERIEYLEGCGHETDDELTLKKFEAAMQLDDKVLLYMK